MPYLVGRPSPELIFVNWMDAIGHVCLSAVIEKLITRSCNIMKLHALSLLSVILLTVTIGLSPTVEADTKNNRLETHADSKSADTTDSTIAGAKSTPATAGQRFRDCPECPEMVVIEPGSFEAGKYLGIGEEEQPLRRVTFGRGFALSRSEITLGQWRAIMGGDTGKISRCGDDCPVENSGWDDVQAFMRQLNQKTGEQYRLPDAMEWEYAFSLAYKHDLYGISSNMFEWVAVTAAPTYFPAEERSAQGGQRMIRGGLWLNSPELLRDAIHGGPEPALRKNRLGFRLLRML